MELPILGKLKDGEKFDFATLANNVEQTDEFWEWWWEHKYEPGKFSRPEIIADDESVLSPTIDKCTVDLVSHSDFFDMTLYRLTKHGVLPARKDVARDAFRAFAQRIVADNNTAQLSQRPQIVFAGGGYGSGKTTTLNFLAMSEALPAGLGLAHHVGVDVFKPLIPEYNLIKAVADGRASLTVQKECQEMASELFESLIGQGRSFIWDSSMSNKDETLARVTIAEQSGYELTMVAVLAPMKIALNRAMHRAKLSRRFPHPEALPKSHTGFRQAFTEYVPHFDEVIVFASEDNPDHTPTVIGHKQGKQNALVPVAGGLLEDALRL